MIRADKTVHGISIRGVQYLISQFADDTDLYLPYDQKIINRVLDILSDVETHLGLLVSYEKTTLYRIGSIANTDAKCYTNRKVRWESDTINTLGIDLYTTQSQLEKNFETVMIKLTTISHIWYYRNLTLTGKIIIINTLMASLFYYRMQTIHVLTNKHIDMYYKVINDFLWKGARAKISLSTLQCSKINGGLGLTNITNKHSALLVKWISIARSHPTVANLANYFLNVEDCNLIWRANLHYTHVKKLWLTNNFWTNVLVNWCKVNYHNPSSWHTIVEQQLWYNSHIMVENTPIYYAGWAQKKILKIADILK